MPKQLMRYLFTSAAAIFAAAIFYNTLIDNEYVYFIRMPDPEVGKIVPYHVKGISVYITIEQYKFIYWLRFVEIISGALILIGALISKINNNES
ncbi:hypothetical protein CK228_16995 [Mesorhizobium sp. WSM4312]|nr:hypothetical protein CK228_16995 [Mesorhizobium sp. WSM4312]